MDELALAGKLDETPVGAVYVACTTVGVVQVWIGAPHMVAFIAAVREHTKLVVIDAREQAPQLVPVLDQALNELRQYFAGTRRAFDVPLDMRALSDFQRRVYDNIRHIPAGRIESYNDIARQLGNPKTIRAVGGALARNPLPIFVPCHRVIGADGTMVGYSGGAGIETKRLLLKLEGALLF
ncbi:MAG: methylated-DNA--[protein]-cysteine S-methyltransferase [Chloroflexi bacterium]|nr:methylated-DNA--[protein]-cysteine S-methyltransferase [Chloroflexota bacterium]